MHIRIAVETDIPEMHRIRVSVRENRLLPDGAVKPDEYSRRLKEDGRGWVAEIEGQIAGFARRVTSCRATNGFREADEFGAPVPPGTNDGFRY